jgi:hypothetical protein
MLGSVQTVTAGVAVNAEKTAIEPPGCSASISQQLLIEFIQLDAEIIAIDKICAQARVHAEFSKQAFLLLGRQRVDPQHRRHKFARGKISCFLRDLCHGLGLHLG